jgi:menaquinone-dependent protoporphyrinogen oxidase
MQVLIVYGTTEGHTRALAHFAAKILREAGHRTTVTEAGGDAAGPDPGAYEGTILASSLHVGRFQSPIVRFAQDRQEVLNSKPTAFISVSLCAAGVNVQDWESLEQCVTRFKHETGWAPAHVHNAAGAIRYGSYDFFKRLVMQFVAAQRGQKTIPSSDYDFTDYDALKAFVLDFASKCQKASAEPVT